MNKNYSNSHFDKKKQGRIQVLIRKIILKTVFVLPVFFSCTKDSSNLTTLKGTIKGRIIAMSERCKVTTSTSSISVTLQGSKPLLQTITDSMGNYVIKDIPAGTYNFEVSKAGYSKYLKQGMQVIGGDVPLEISDTYIIPQSGVTVRNISFLTENNELHLKGTVCFDTSVISFPTIRYYLHTAENLSSAEYTQTGVLQLFDATNNSLFNRKISVSKSLISSGTKIYLIAYGTTDCSDCSGDSYRDILTNKEIFLGLGQPSDVVSAIVP